MLQKTGDTPLDQPVGHITQLRLRPIRPLWSVGPGWAVIGGAIASGGLALAPQALFSLVLTWLLADAVLGVVWDLGAGDTAPGGKGGIWRALLTAHLPDSAPALRFLPYTQPASPGRHLAERLSRWRRWWQETFSPQSGAEFAALVAALGLALLVGTVLGRDALALTLLSIALSWLAALAHKSERPAARNAVTLWHTLGSFGIPWLLGSLALGRPTWVVIALGSCYAITYFGLAHQAARTAPAFRLIGASQVAAILLLAGLRYPLAAGAAAILLLPQWGLHTWAADHSVVLLRRIQPFVVLSLLIATWAVTA
jgi:hypothetical protein